MIKTRDKKLIKDIMLALTTPGDLMTDGECLDQVWSLIESAGYNIKEVQKQQEKKQQ